MSVAIVSCHELEEAYGLEATAESFLSHGIDVIVGYDRGVPDHHRDVISRLKSSYGDRLSVEISNSVGIGANRDYLARRVVDAGYRYMIQSDCHVKLVRFSDPRDNAVFYNYAVSDSEFADAEKYADKKVVFIGTIPDILDIRSVVFVYKAERIFFFNEPVFEVRVDLLRQLMDIQSGHIYLLKGYGYEVADLMLSLSRLGHFFRVYDNLYAHRINTGSEDRWVRRWDPLQLELYSLNLSLFEYKHDFPRKYFSEGMRSKYRDLFDIADQFNKHAKYSLTDIYDIIIRDIVERRTITS
ncbi:MAG: hypothetical protein C0179_03525 [Fervidicoccus sp.]|nr:MAG: hypothetical protein C0179_03525 [Fervidicoccus sp.]